MPQLQFPVLLSLVQVTTGAAAEYRDLKIILAHAGAFIPFVASRIGFAATAISGGGLAQAGVGDANIELLKRFYVDTALSSEACFLSHTQYTHARVDTKYDQPTGHCSVLKVLWVVVDVHWSLTAAAVCT